MKAKRVLAMILGLILLLSVCGCDLRGHTPKGPLFPSITDGQGTDNDQITPDDPTNGDTDNGDTDNGDTDNGDTDNGDTDNGDTDNGDGGNEEPDEGNDSPPEVKAPLTLSKESGVYESAFDLTVTAEDETHKIYYALDGSIPTTASLRYDGAIAVTEGAGRSYPLTYGVQWNAYDYGDYNFSTGNCATVVRLLEVDESGKEVARKTATYFIGKAFSLPVVSLSMPEKDALKFYNDIEKESKARAEVEYFDFASGERFACNTQIKIGGNWTKGYPYRKMNLNFN